MVEKNKERIQVWWEWFSEVKVNLRMNGKWREKVMDYAETLLLLPWIKYKVTSLQYIMIGVILNRQWWVSLMFTSTYISLAGATVVVDLLLDLKWVLSTMSEQHHLSSWLGVSYLGS